MSDEPGPDRIAKLALAGGFIAWLAHALARLFTNPPLGHDEAQYAIDARDLLAGEPSRYIYTSGGMQGLALPGVLAGGDERALRALPLLVGVGFLVAAWYLARRLFNATTAAWTVGVLATGPQLLRWSASLMSDLPTTAGLLAGMAVLFSELARPDGPRRRILLAAPCLAFAFHLRYASCVPIGIIGAAALACFPRPILNHPRLVLATAGLLLALVLPHFIHATRATGSPLGVILTSAGVPREGEGIIEYVKNPRAAYGIAVAPLMVIGALAFQRNRISIALQATALAQVVILGVLTHAQPRYIFFATVLLVIRGVDVLRTLAPRLGRARKPIAIVALAILAALWLVQLTRLFRYGAADYTTKVAAIQVSALAMKRDANGAPCEVLGRHQTQLEWYGGCRGVLLVPHESIAAGKHTYAIWDLSGGPYQQHLPSMPGVYILHLPGFAGVKRMSP